MRSSPNALHSVTHPGVAPAPQYGDTSDAVATTYGMAAVSQQSPPMIRVLYVLPTLEVGGQERLVADLARAVRSWGVEPSVVGLTGGGAIETELRAGEIPASVVAPRAHLPGYPAALIAYLRSHPVDLLHCHSGSWFPTAMAGRVLGLPVLHTEHGRYPNEPPWSVWTDRLAWRFTDRLIVVSEKLQHDMTARLRLSTPPEILANGVTLPDALPGEARARARRQLGLPEQALVVGTVGRLVEVKNHALLLQAIARLAPDHPALHCVMVGDGPLRGALTAETARLGLTVRTHWLGQRSDAARIAGLFDVYVSSSVTEGTPMAVLEAMAAGTPVVATAVGGLPHVLAQGDAGVLVPSQDVHALASALDSLLRDAGRREVLGAAARSRVESQFSLSACARRYAEVYAELVRRRGASGR